LISIKVVDRMQSEPTNVPDTDRDDSLIQIEETQAALRDSIEKAKALTKESERLVRKHRQESDAPPPVPE
jgi:hypothetical protein